MPLETETRSIETETTAFETETSLETLTSLVDGGLLNVSVILSLIRTCH